MAAEEEEGEQHEDWERNEKKRYNFHMNLYETWIYYDFSPRCRVVCSLEGKKFKLFFAEALKGCSRATLETTARQVRWDEKKHTFQSLKSAFDVVHAEAGKCTRELHWMSFHPRDTWIMKEAKQYLPAVSCFASVARETTSACNEQLECEAKRRIPINHCSHYSAIIFAEELPLRTKAYLPCELNSAELSR